MSTMRPTFFTSTLAAAALALATGAYAAGEHREQGAHKHGHGSFEMAIDKTTVTIELRVPGADIVGFEHAPKTNAEKAAISNAKKKLADALGLFGLPKAAECKVTDADVHVHGAGEDGHKHDHGEKKPAEKKAADKPADKAADTHNHADGHASFHAKYTLTCAKPAAITSLAFTFFKAFPKSEELEVVAVSEKGQVKAEAKPKAPTVSLAKLW